MKQAGRLPPKQQGDLGEADAIAVLTRLGGEVSAPLFSSPNYDLVVDFGAGLQRVQVKTSTAEERPGRYMRPTLNQRRKPELERPGAGLRSQSLRSALRTPLDRQRWLIPATAVDASRPASCLGGAKYRRVRVARGAAARTPRAGYGPTIRAAPGELRSWRIGPGCKSTWLALSGFDSLLPHPTTLKRRCSTPGSDGAAVGRTRISTGHQLTIPIGPFRAAELRVGDRLEVVVESPGRVLLCRVHPAEAAADPEQAEARTPTQEETADAEGQHHRA